MSASVPSSLATTDDLLAMPDDGVERWLIRGVINEESTPVRSRFHDRFHSGIMALLCKHLGCWLDEQSKPRGKVFCGEAGVRLIHDPETMVGVDVVYISAETAANQTDATTLVDGVPVLAVEILSPSDTMEEIADKTNTYLAAGVALVWIVNPLDQSILVHRPGQRAQYFTLGQEIANEPHLPGLRLPISSVFG